jgi:hypothetical protein
MGAQGLNSPARAFAKAAVNISTVIGRRAWHHAQRGILPDFSFPI